MPSATVTSKGQITIPRDVRRALGLRPGDRLAFRLRDDGTATLEAETVDIRKLKGVVKPRGRGVTPERMAEAVRETAVKRYRKATSR